MSGRLSDDMIDSQLVAYLKGRAEDGAARARTPEQLATEISARTRPRFALDRGVTPIVRLAWLLAAALLVLALVASLLAGSHLLSPIQTRLVTIAIELPLGSSNRNAEPILQGVTLALKDAPIEAGQTRVEVRAAATFSDVSAGVADASRGAANMRQIVADPAVVAVIGPFDSSVAQEQIPISGAAGLLQCSPASTAPTLTQTSGASVQPSGSPARGSRSFVRTVTTDDVAAAGAARYVFERLGKATVYVVDDHQGYGTAMADWFEAEFTRLGGSVISRGSLPASAAELQAFVATIRAANPQALYFGGTTDRGAQFVKEAAAGGLGALPFVGTDALTDGSPAVPGSFLNRVGDGAQQAHAVFPGAVNGPGTTSFQARFRAAYGAEPTPFAALGYACAQVVLAAVQSVDPDPAASAPDAREAVRAAGLEPNATFETLIGPLMFDARGDVSPKVVTIFGYDAAARDWVVADQIGLGR